MADPPLAFVVRHDNEAFYALCLRGGITSGKVARTDNIEREREGEREEEAESRENFADIPGFTLSERDVEKERREEGRNARPSHRGRFFRSYLPTHDFPAVTRAKNSCAVLHTDRSSYSL